MTHQPAIAVIVASLGRPQNLAALLERLAHQTMMPARVILSMESEADAPPDATYPFETQRIFGPRGMTVQRNRALDILGEEIDVAVFYDDDFVPSRYAIAGISDFFNAHPEISGAEGLVIADGINGPGIPPDEARRIMDDADGSGAFNSPRILRHKHGLYGCNMAYRVSAVEDIRFDEKLPLYAWLEDLDFGGRLGGLLVQTDAFRGVHCGEKRGREKNGRRLGYSQIVNPIYMIRKKTLPSRIAMNLVFRNFVANHVRVFLPESWIDRKGRVVGNWIAIFDIAKGRIDPERILEIE